MARNNITAAEEYFANDASPLAEGEVWVNFVLEPDETPEEEEIIQVRLQVQRSLLTSEESAKAIIPTLLSCTAPPDFFHRCPEFIKDVSEYISSLPTDVHHVYVYGYVVLDDIDPTEGEWWFYLSTEDLISIDEQVMMSHRWFESAVEAVKAVKIEEASECAICLQDLVVGIEAAKLPCSHVYHRPCIVKWFDTSNQCPLCRSRVA